MVEFYHYLFYKAFLWQVRRMKDVDIPVYSSVMLISFFMSMNFMTVYDSIAYFGFHNRFTSIWTAWIPSIIIALVNYGYYKKNSYWKSVVSWGDALSSSERRRRNWIYYSYEIMTYILFFSMELYVIPKNIFRYY